MNYFIGETSYENFVLENTIGLELVCDKDKQKARIPINRKEIINNYETTGHLYFNGVIIGTMSFV